MNFRAHNSTLRAPGFEAAIVASSFGIPLRWFQQIDAACDAWAARKGIAMEPSMRQRISLDMEAGMARKAERDRVTVNFKLQASSSELPR